MLTRESLWLIFDELNYYARIVAVFSRLVPPYPIGSVDKKWFKYRLILLVDFGCRDRWICNKAVKTGSLKCLKYARDHGCSWDTDTSAWAAQTGSLACLEYAHKHGCPWDRWTCTYAAGHGSLECLEYAHEHGCPWDEWTCTYAANAGSLKCLKYAHEHGCPWDKLTRTYALTEACLDYAIFNGCPQ